VLGVSCNVTPPFKLALVVAASGLHCISLGWSSQRTNKVLARMAFNPKANCRMWVGTRICDAGNSEDCMVDGP
jgi:hypothetical protein